MKRTLSVRLHGVPIGILEENDGTLEFKYLPDAKRLLSLSLPLQEKVFRGTVCNAYFGGLLPESETVRKLLGRRFGINSNNTFSLLAAIGLDCAGAVSFHEPDAAVKEDANFHLQAKILSDEELEKHITSLPLPPILEGTDEIRLSLAGVQEKTAVCLIDNKVALPIGGCSTTHILKPASNVFPELIENEYLCLKAAKAVGIDVPHIEIGQVNGLKYFLIERYDREITDNKIKRIHQEDFAQALGFPASQKYEQEEGPGFKDCFNLINKFSVPAVDKIKFIERAVFNYLIGNTDAHSKNFSLLHYDNGMIQFAPAYDILCTMAYEKHSEWMAMKIGNTIRISAVKKTDWEEFSTNVGFRYKGIEETLKTQSEKLPSVIEKESQNLKDKGYSGVIGEKILKYAEKSCSKMR